VKSRRWIWLVPGFWLLCAPTPGSVGSCGGDDQSQPADFSSYCQQREELGCVRRFLRKEITAEARDSCRWDAIDACARSSFPADCRPTRRQAQACLNALASFDTLQTAETDVAECKQKSLCNAAPSQQLDAGVGDAGVVNP
jgi:hypothetical protein